MVKGLRVIMLVVLMGLFLTVAFVAAGCGKQTSEPKANGKPSAGGFPTRPITLVVPYAAGGSSDLSARPVAEAVGRILGQPVVVVNKPGAGGSIGATEVAKAKADGYTLLNASIGPVTIVPYTSKVDYDYRSFKPVAQITDIPLALTVGKNSPFNSVKDFVAFAKANPGKLKYGSPGAGNIQHVTMEGFARDQGFKVTHMPFEGASPAVAALLGGNVDATVTGITEVIPHYLSGQVKILGVTATERSSFLPEVPTFKEQGYDLVAGVWYGILAPKDTPDEVVRTLADAFKQAMQDPGVLDAYKKLYLETAYLGPEEFGKRIESDAARNQEIVKAIGLAAK